MASVSIRHGLYMCTGVRIPGLYLQSGFSAFTANLKVLQYYYLAQFGHVEEFMCDVCVEWNTMH